MPDKTIKEYFNDLKVSTTIFEERMDRYRWLLANVNKLKHYVKLASEAAMDDSVYQREEWCCGYLACLSDLLDNVVELEADAVM